MTRPRKKRFASKAGIEPRPAALEADALTTSLHLLMPLHSLWNKGSQQHLSSELGSGWSSLARPHVVPAAFISASVLLRQVCFVRPTLCFPCGFQSRACLVMLDAGFRSVWPIQPHLLFLISVSIGVCFVLSHNCSFETTSGHLMLRMFLRHLSVNVLQ